MAGEISFDTFNRLSQNYICEQGELEQKINSASQEIKNLDAKKADIGAFMRTIKSYTEITELTPEILAEFIDKILVHAAEKVNGKRTVKVDIYFKGVGNIQV